MQEDRESVNPESTTLDSITPESVTIVDDQMPTLKTGAKRSLPTATKDEWSDSSDDEVNQSVDGNGNGTSNVDQTFTSEYFRFNASEKAGESSSSKRPKIVANPRGGDRVTAKQPAAKALSMSSMHCPCQVRTVHVKYAIFTGMSMYKLTCVPNS